MTYFNSVSALTIGAVLSTSLILGGCNDKNKANHDLAVVNVKPRIVKEAEAQQALKVLALDESGAGNMTWASKSGKAGHYTYTDVVFGGEDKDKVDFGKLEIKGAHMEGDLAVFDQITLFDLAKAENDEYIKIAELSLTKPSPALANAFGDMVRGNKDALKNVEGDISFQGFNLVSMDAKSDDANMDLNSLSFAQHHDKTGTFKIESLNFNTLENNKKMSLSLDSFDVTGVNIQKYKGLANQVMKEGQSSHMATQGVMQDMMAGMNPYDPDFKNMRLRDLDIDANGILIELDSYEGNTKNKGDKTYVTMDMSPLIVTPPAESSDAGVKAFMDSLETMGYDQLSFTMGGTSVLDESNDTMSSEDTYLQLKDGFTLSYNYAIKGYQAFMEQAYTSENGPDDAKAAMDALGNLAINSLEISLKDESIIERSFKLAAKQNGTDPAALKQQAKMGLGFAGMMAKDQAQQKLATDFAAAASALIDNGGTLTIKMDPKDSFNFGSLIAGGGTDIDVEAMNISVSHK